MAPRTSRVVARALFSVIDAGDAIDRGQAQGAVAALDRAKQELSSIDHSLGMSISDASEILEVSEPTVRSWVQRGALQAVPQSKPLQVDSQSLHKASRALADLRERGQDREWLDSLMDYMTDRGDRRSEAVKQGLNQMKRGELKPA